MYNDISAILNETPDERAHVQQSDAVENALSVAVCKRTTKNAVATWGKLQLVLIVFCQR